MRLSENVHRPITSEARGVRGNDESDVPVFGNTVRMRY